MYRSRWWDRRKESRGTRLGLITVMSHDLIAIKTMKVFCQRQLDTGASGWNITNLKEGKEEKGRGVVQCSTLNICLTD